jgi:hypothetical protein
LLRNQNRRGGIHKAEFDIRGSWRDKKKAALKLLLFAEYQSLGGGFSIFITEALNTSTHGVNRFLRACVEGMRFAGGVQLVQGQFSTVIHFDGFFGVGTSACDKFETIGQVLETDFSVLRVNAIFHFDSFFNSTATRANLLHFSQPSIMP